MKKHRPHSLLLFILAGLSMYCQPSLALGAIITSSDGAFQVGLGNLGNLYDPNANVGFLRTSDGYDPIAAGLGREAWGVSAGSTSGYVDPNNSSIVNIVPNGSPVFGSHSASISAFLNAGSNNLLRIDQQYQFAASNVLEISTSLTNVSGVSQATLFSRNVSWDIPPTDNLTLVTIPALVTPIQDASYYGFESADPLVPFSFSSGPSGGIFGPDVLGAGMLINTGTLAPGGSYSFNVFEAINQTGQDGAGLQSELQSLGASFVITGASVDPVNPNNYAALGFGPLSPPSTAVPEPGSLTLLLSAGFFSAIGYGFRRRGYLCSAIRT
jgi:hypothetical protein